MGGGRRESRLAPQEGAAPGAGDMRSRATAVAVARQLSGARPDLTIVNVPVWAFPHFTVLAAQETSGAVLLVSNVDPQYPGMVGMLAAGGGLDQMGRLHERALGEVEGHPVLVPVYSHAL